MSTNLKWEFQARKLIEYEPVINLGIPEPWTFKAVNIATEGTEYEKVVYFGVESFDERLIRELQFRDKSSFVTVTPVIDPLPKGTFCKLKPQNERFLTLLTELGPKVLLEQLLKTYSVLQLNQHIELCHDRVVYLLQVTELKPSKVVMIRNTDLEVEFDENKMVTPQTPITPSNPFGFVSRTSPSSSPSASEYDYIITDSDGENIVINGEDLPDTKVMVHKDRILKNKSTSSLNSEISDNNNNNNQPPPPPSSSSTFSSSSSSSTTTTQQKVALPPASNSSSDNINNNNIPIEGISLPSPPPTDSTQCNHCLHYIPNATYEMHELRCNKNSNYKGKICDICNRVITISDEERHVHCKICKDLFTKTTIDQHILLTHEKLKCIKCNKEFNGGEEYILHTSDMRVCPVCEMKLLNCEYNQHFLYCASKTLKCDYCKKYITYLKIEEHFYRCHRGKMCPVKIGNFNPNDYNEKEEEERERRNSNEMEREDDEDEDDDDSDDDKEEEEEENDYDDVKSEDEDD